MNQKNTKKANETEPKKEAARNEKVDVPQSQERVKRGKKKK